MAELASLVQRLEVAVSRLEAVSGAGVASAGSGAGAVFVEAYNSLLSGPVEEYLSLSQQIGGDVQKQAEMMKRVFSCQKQFLITASSSQKPSDAVLSTLLAPLSSVIQQVQSFREQNRSSTFFNHLSAVSESVPALGWVAIVSAPPPPPGPPPPQVDLDQSPAAGDSGATSRNALFASINKGSDITKGLKHVSDDQKTHKNPALKTHGGPVCSGPKPFSIPQPAASSAPSRMGPRVLELEGKKWRVENQDGAQGLVISDTELKQVVYAFKCNNSTLQVKGKINSITIDNCKKLGLVFDDVVGIVEVINCKDIKLQVMGKVPTISINKTDGCHVYLSAASLDCEIVSAKSSEMNVLVPGAGGDFTELPVPEQFKTVWDGKKLVTTATEIAG
uniref:Adenylyl cyclase-associated protein n=1 Tax=Scleropages formosus TaxID=113540 RepID=A0A8C9TXG3_SCLFO